MLKLRGTNDEDVLRSLKAHPHFLPPARIRPKLVLDLGCWIGYSSIVFAEKWPRAAIIAVEADEENADLARENCEGLNITVVSATVGIPGSRVLYKEAKNQRTLFGDWVGTEVEVISVDQLLANLGESRVIDFCKMDVERAELECLEGEWINRVKKILVDTHEGNTEQVLDRLRELRFKIVGGGEVYGSSEETWYAVRRR